MILQVLINLLGVRAVGAIGDVFLIMPVVWAAFKLSYQSALHRPMPRNVVVDIVDVIVEFMNNLPGALNRAVRLRGGDSIFKSPEPPDGDSRETRPPPPIVMSLMFVMMLACSAARSSLLDANRMIPRRGTCGAHAEDTEWCQGKVPMVCLADEDGSTVMRGWPLYGFDNEHKPAACAIGCVVTTEGAHCTDTVPEEQTP